MKLDTPEAAFFVAVPLRVPPLGLVPIATVMEAVEVVIVLPTLSCTVIVGGPPIVLPVVAFPGCVVNANFAAVPTLILKPLLVAPVRPVDDAVNV